MGSLALWLLFAGVVLASLVIDLIVHRGGRGLGRKSALIWSIVWIVVALLFAGWVGLQLGSDQAGDFLSAYLMEKSLSIDNLFVFMVVFSRLRIPEAEQHRVLFWGILGALISRAVFIAGGTALLARWHDVVYALGVFLIYTAYRTARARASHHGDSRVMRFLRRHLPLTPDLHGHRFIAVEKGRRVGTPLLLALLTIEATDILFAIDSVPAVFAISEKPFIVYSSNVFAVLGLRALYLVLADLLKDLRYLHYGLAAILALAGIKMLVSGFVHVPHYASLLSILVILAAAIIPSLIAARRGRRRVPPAAGATVEWPMHQTSGMPDRRPSRSYEEIVRRTVRDMDWSWRPSLEQERRAFEGFRAMDSGEQELFDRVHDALIAAGFNPPRLTIEIDRERVILRGQVRDQRSLAQIPDVVGAVEGVRSVTNLLVLAAD